MPTKKSENNKKSAPKLPGNTVLQIISRYKFSILAVAALLFGVTALLLVSRESRNQEPAKLEVAVAKAETEPGSLAVISINLKDVAVEGLQECRSVKKADNGLVCQIADEKQTLKFKAPQTVQKDDGTYTFGSWTGCSEVKETVCTMTVIEGERLKLKLQYLPPEVGVKAAAAATSTSEPHLELAVEGFPAAPAGSLVSFGLRTNDGASTVDVALKLATRNLDINTCVITNNIVLDDTARTKQTVTYPSKATQMVTLADGDHAIRVECSVGNETLSAQLKGTVADRQPKLCKGFAFTDASPTVSSLSQLKSGLVGTWKGCVTTPWMPSYFVTIHFGNDGKYTAVADEVIDGVQTVPMYYGRQQKDPQSTYVINDFSASNTGSGTFNIVFDDGSGSVVEEDMRNIKLMGDKLSFEFKHFNQYGPLKFQLNRR